MRNSNQPTTMQTLDRRNIKSENKISLEDFNISHKSSSDMPSSMINDIKKVKY